MDQLRMEMDRVNKYNFTSKFLSNINHFLHFKSKEFSSSNQKAIEGEMISIKHRYLEIQEQLRMAEKVNKIN